jgi:hypothetical protein
MIDVGIVTVHAVTWGRGWGNVKRGCAAELEGAAVYIYADKTCGLIEIKERCIREWRIAKRLGAISPTTSNRKILPGASLLVAGLLTRVRGRALEDFRSGKGMEWGEHHPFGARSRPHLAASASSGNYQKSGLSGRFTEYPR